MQTPKTNRLHSLIYGYLQIAQKDISDG